MKYKKNRGKVKDVFLDLAFSLVLFGGLFAFTKRYDLMIPFMTMGFGMIGFRIYSLKANKLATKSKFLKSGISIVDKMEGVEFEKFLGAHYEKQGYVVEFTPVTNDYGADLILSKNGVKIVVQAKRWNGKVGNKAIQEVNSAKGHYNADNAWVITNSLFTKQAVELAKSNNVELIDRNALIQLMIDNGCSESLHYSNPESICPSCGSSLIERNGRYGSFIGCSNYPTCSYTQKLNERGNM